jgi:rubrerythrin
MPENYLDCLKKALREGWRRCFDALLPDQHQILLDILRQTYREGAEDAVQLAEHAKRLYYPQFRERLRRIAEEEQAHVTWLRDKLLALGAQVPEVSITPKDARNTWEALLMDLEEEKRSYADVLEAMHLAQQVDPELAEGLRRIREVERQHREEILDILEKSDPAAFLPPSAEEPAREGQPQG